MKITLLAINAKYVHSSLAVWYLANGLAKYSGQCHDVNIVEATINQDTNDIAGLVTCGKPDLVGISTYIWNAGKLPGLISGLRRHLPDVLIVLGGPEASHNAKYWLAGGADYVIRGEGEHVFPAFLDLLDESNPVHQSNERFQADASEPCRSLGKTWTLNDISGLCFYKDGERISPQVKLPYEYISPYSREYFQALGGRITYIEASRGCPFSCAFCLSGGSGVRFFPLETVKEQINKLLGSCTKTIKFVDRTFNCNPERAYKIFEYVINLNTECCFHFEAAADLFNEETLSLLSTSPPGRIQLEIGLQSFHKPSLDAVSRKTNLEKAEENIRKLLSHQNIHIHIDLIAGLPYETLPVFQDSFNRAFALEAHTLQLGFLKLIHGSKLREQANTLGITYSKEPPYEIISSPWLGEKDLEILKFAENALQHTYNKGWFLSVLRYVLSVSGLTPFVFFYRLGKAALSQATPLEKYARQVYDYCSGLQNIDKNKLSDCMICDFLRMTKGKNMPGFLKSRGEKRKQAVRMANKQLGRVIDYDEAAVLSSGKGAYADSLSRDPVTGLYKLYW